MNEPKDASEYQLCSPSKEELEQKLMDWTRRRRWMMGNEWYLCKLGNLVDIEHALAQRISPG